MVHILSPFEARSKTSRELRDDDLSVLACQQVEMFYHLDLFQTRNMQVFILESALVTLKEATVF